MFYLLDEVLAVGGSAEGRQQELLPLELRDELVPAGHQHLVLVQLLRRLLQHGGLDLRQQGADGGAGGGLRQGRLVARVAAHAQDLAAGEVTGTHLQPEGHALGGEKMGITWCGCHLIERTGVT